MVYSNTIGGKGKPRGKPFPKGKNKQPVNATMDASGRESGNKRGVIAPSINSAIVEPINEEPGIFHQLPKAVMETVDKLIKESMDKPKDVQSEGLEIPKEIEGKKDLELIESVNFKNGENTLSIRFSKRHNRMFRIQVFLNENLEIRPVTYTGANTGYTFWNLLKGAFKK
jgi:hypothetical protein